MPYGFRISVVMVIEFIDASHIVLCSGYYYPSLLIYSTVHCMYYFRHGKTYMGLVFVILTGQGFFIVFAIALQVFHSLLQAMYSTPCIIGINIVRANVFTVECLFSLPVHRWNCPMHSTISLSSSTFTLAFLQSDAHQLHSCYWAPIVFVSETDLTLPLGC